MNNCKRSLFLSLLIAASSPLLAQEEPVLSHQDVPTAPDAGEETPALPEGATSQGEFAIKFANKLGLWKGMTRPLTASKAISLLSEIEITPFGGWNAAKALTPNDFARMLVQSLKEMDEIDDAEEDNPETTAYMDFLKRKYDLDIKEINLSDANIVGKGATTPSGQFRDDASTNPLENRGGDGNIDELREAGLSSGASVIVSDAEVDRVLASTAPSQGDGDRVDDSVSNTTPSAPSP